MPTAAQPQYSRYSQAVKEKIQAVKEKMEVQVGHLHLRHYHTRRSQRLSALPITLSKLLKKTMMGNFPIAEKNYRSGNPVQITGTTSHSDSSDCIAP